MVFSKEEKYNPKKIKIKNKLSYESEKNIQAAADSRAPTPFEFRLPINEGLLVQQALCFAIIESFHLFTIDSNVYYPTSVSGKLSKGTTKELQYTKLSFKHYIFLQAVSKPNSIVN